MFGKGNSDGVVSINMLLLRHKGSFVSSELRQPRQGLLESDEEMFSLYPTLEASFPQMLLATSRHK